MQQVPSNPHTTVNRFFSVEGGTIVGRRGEFLSPYLSLSKAHTKSRNPTASEILNQLGLRYYGSLTLLHWFLAISFQYFNIRPTLLIYFLSYAYYYPNDALSLTPIFDIITSPYHHHKAPSQFSLHLLLTSKIPLNTFLLNLSITILCVA